MRRHAPFEPIDPNICMWGGVADIINRAKFFENPSKGFGAVRPRKIAFPIEIVHHPYNSVGTTVPHCDTVSMRDGTGSPGNRSVGLGRVTWCLTQFWVLTCVFIVALFLQSNTISANHKCRNEDNVKSRNVVTSQETETADINLRFRFLVEI